MVIHDGNRAPRLRDAWNPNDTDWVWFAWDDLLGDSVTISSSTWTLPANWAQSDNATGATVTDEEGNSFTAANGVLLTYSGSDTGLFEITNSVELSDSRVLYRTLKIEIKEAAI